MSLAYLRFYREIATAIATAIFRYDVQHRLEKVLKELKYLFRQFFNPIDLVQIFDPVFMFDPPFIDNRYYRQ